MRRFIEVQRGDLPRGFGSSLASMLPDHSNVNTQYAEDRKFMDRQNQRELLEKARRAELYRRAHIAVAALGGEVLEVEFRI